MDEDLADLMFEDPFEASASVSAKSNVAEAPLL